MTYRLSELQPVYRLDRRCPLSRTLLMRHYGAASSIEQATRQLWSLVGLYLELAMHDDV